MPTAPKADPPQCDVPGCGHLADHMTDSTEIDVQKPGRKALPKVNVCKNHENWPFSDDAREWSNRSASYKQR